MEYSKEFEVFWKLYPHRNGKPIKKRPAWNMWQRLTDDEIYEICTKAKYIKQFEGGPYARDAVTWLHPENQRGWEDITFKPDWVPVLPAELTDVCKAPADKVENPGTRRTFLIRQLRKA